MSATRMREEKDSVMSKITKINHGLIAAVLVSNIGFALTARCQQTEMNDQAGVTPAPKLVGSAPTVSPVQPSDDEVRQQVIEALKDAGIKEPVRVEAKDGLVALKGEVSSLVDRMRIVDAVKGVPGVRAVVRYVDVKPLPRSDADIEKDIRAALEKNPATRGMSPIVSVDRGVVAIAANGSDWQVKHLARWLAENVPGVREVLNPLCSPYETGSNSEVKKAIADRLAISRPNFENVSVEVSDGRVVLSGRVRTVADKLRAVSAAYVADVRSVNSRGLQVDLVSAGRSGSGTAPNDQEIERAVETAFAHDPRLRAAKLKLSVENSIVTLSGDAYDLNVRSVAGMLAAQIPGVSDVKNDLSIRTNHKRSDNELAAALRNAYLSDPSLDVFQLRVSVDHGRAMLRGTANTMNEKWKAENIAKCIWGIKAIDNQLDVIGTPEPPVVSHTFFNSSDFAELWWMVPVKDVKSDSTLKAEVEHQLFWSPFTNARTTAVAVASGVVALTGSTQNDAEKKAAEDAAYEAGALKVNNRLEVAGENQLTQETSSVQATAGAH